MKQDHFLVGIHVTDRVQKIPEVQKVLTEYGCHIRTRLGLHEASEGFCSPNGVIVLDMLYDKGACGELVEKLAALEGIEVKTMRFPHG